MKIGGKKPGGVGSDNFVKKTGESAPPKQGGSQATGGAGKSPGDSVDISPKARELTRAKGLLGSVPDIRTEKVVRLKSDIELGAYEVDAGKVAERMIERAVRDALHQKK